ncbi:MAG: hypothetical protein C4K49_04410 [Candidatus Thorarchaeota archaeon]|nr:MAG: hypothetical protein C4K49_04410 [Candidatus Thorarchaeota archaeon]
MSSDVRTRTELNNDLLEGQFIVTRDAHIFEVKGSIHPPSRVVAYLRYVPTSDGDRCSVSGVRYKKVYSLSDREGYLRERHPEYLWYDEVYGRELQTVPLDHISRVLDPITCLNAMKDKGDNATSLERASVRLSRVLVHGANLNWSDIGLSGSQLAGLAASGSDIDLVVYGTAPAKRVVSFLRSAGRVPGLSHYSGERLDHIVTSRWGIDAEWKPLLAAIESKKVLQGVFECCDFFIRNVKLRNELGYGYGDLLFKNLGVRSVKGVVVDDAESIFTPCAYIVQCSQMSTLRQIVSYRGRFTEQVSNRATVVAQGRLESVTVTTTGEGFLQLVVGESPFDYLLPVG